MIHTLIGRTSFALILIFLIGAIWLGITMKTVDGLATVHKSPIPIAEFKETANSLTLEFEINSSYLPIARNEDNQALWRYAVSADDRADRHFDTDSYCKLSMTGNGSIKHAKDADAKEPEVVFSDTWEVYWEKTKSMHAIYKFAFKEIEAKLVQDGDSITKVAVSLDLDSDLASNTVFCFEVPVNIDRAYFSERYLGDQSSSTFFSSFYYLYELENEDSFTTQTAYSLYFESRAEQQLPGLPIFGVRSQIMETASNLTLSVDEDTFGGFSKNNPVLWRYAVSDNTDDIIQKCKELEQWNRDGQPSSHSISSASDWNINWQANLEAQSSKGLIFQEIEMTIEKNDAFISIDAKPNSTFCFEVPMTGGILIGPPPVLYQKFFSYYFIYTSKNNSDDAPDPLPVPDPPPDDPDPLPIPDPPPDDPNPLPVPDPPPDDPNPLPIPDPPPDNNNDGATNPPEESNNLLLPIVSSLMVVIAVAGIIALMVVSKKQKQKQ